MRKQFVLTCLFTALLAATRSLAQDVLTEKSGFALEAQNFSEQAAQYFDARDYEKAAEYYREAAAADPEDKNALYNLGLAHYQLGNYGKAELALDQLIESNPTDTAAYELYGLTLFHRQHYDRAIAAFNLVLRAKPSADLYVAKAWAYVSTGRSKPALQCFDEALRLNPANFAACLGKGTALVDLGQCPLAISWLDQALAIQPGNATALSNRAIAKFKAGNKDAAMDDFRLALAEDRQSNVFLARARCLMSDGNTADAYADVKEAMLLGDKNPETYCLMGELEECKGNQAAAIELYDAAINLKPGCTAYTLKRCGAMIKNDQCYDAIGDLYRLLDQEPLNGQAKQMLLLAYSRIDAQLAAGNGL